MKMIRRVFSTFSDFKWRMVVVILIGILGVVLYSMMPTYLNFGLEKLETAILKNGSVPDNEVSFIIKMLGIFLGLALINEVFAILCVFLILHYEAKVTQRLTVAVKSKLDVVPTRFLESYNTGDLTRIVCYNVADMMKNVLLVVYQISRAMFFFVTTSIAMFGVSSVLAIVVILSLPLCVLVAQFVSKRTQKYFKAQNETNGRLSTYLDQKVSLHGFYRMHGLDGDTSEFHARSGEHTKALIGEITATTLNTIYVTFIRNFMYVLITVLCCILALPSNGGLAIAALPTFLLFSQRFLDNTVVVTSATNILQVMAARANHVFGVLDGAEDVTEREHIEIDKINGAIEFKKVSLIDDNYVSLDKISFVIPQGASVAIVGPTGSGKHRLVELIAKLDNPTSGTITLGGIDLSEIKSSSFYRRMGMASEKPFIFKSTVAENILYGVGRALPENVMKITKLLGSHGFIEQLPRGYETKIYDTTSLLSISQKQAINVARTVLQSPDLVILDSALTMADNIIEKQVFDEVRKLNKNQTKIFVTNRLGNVQDCDLIMFMENGKIVEKGTHDELMKRKRKYYKAFTGN